MPEWLVQALAIIGSSAIVFGLIYGAIKLVIAIQRKLADVAWTKHRVERLEDITRSTEKYCHGELKMLWDAVDNINKRLRDAEKKT